MQSQGFDFELFLSKKIFGNKKKRFAVSKQIFLPLHATKENSTNNSVQTTRYKRLCTNDSVQTTPCKRLGANDSVQTNRYKQIGTNKSVQTT